MDEKDIQKVIEALEGKFKTILDETMGDKLKEIVGPMVAESVGRTVQKMAAERAIFGRDITGLTKDQKEDFVKEVKAFLGGQIKAQVSEDDSAGGYLVPVEVAAAILRITQDTGLIASQARFWPMATDQLDIPRYTGSALTGAYLGVDAAGSVTTLAFGAASLIAKKWQLAFAVGNDLFADASANLADWLLALAGESMANSIDSQGFEGTGLPFVGALESSLVTTVTLASGKETFAEYDVVADSATVIANLESTILGGAAFYMHATMWASLRVQEDTNGNLILNAFGRPLTDFPKQGGRSAAGEILGYPVFTTPYLPSLADTAVSTKYMVFGNLAVGFAFGNKGPMRLARHEAGSFGGKEIALADQTGLVYKQRHAIVITLGAAIVAVKTAAS